MDDDKVLRVVDSEMVRRYVEDGGCKCLFCGSHSIEGDHCDVDSGGASQVVRCGDCGGEWTDMHSLVGVMACNLILEPGTRRGK